MSVFERFLGVDETAGAAALLGLAPDQCEPVQIEAALRRRLGQIYKHPQANSEEAEQVRQVLRAAADQLKRIADQRRAAEIGLPAPPPAPPILPRRSTHPPIFNLTAFDRLALAALIGCGGWNADSRARLVALASAHGVSVQGLIRVVHGLSQYAQSGGARLGVGEITGGQIIAPQFPTPSASPAAPAILDRLTENLSAELKRDDVWPTIKLSVLFGLLTLAVCIIGLRIVFSNNAGPSAISHPAGPAGGLNPPLRTAPRASTQPATETTRPKLATYPQHPTFLGNALPAEALAAVAQFNDLPQQLDDITRHIIVEPTPAEAVYHNWDVCIQTIAAGWQLADLSSRKQVERKLNEALRAAGDRPTVSDRLLNSFTPPGSLTEPLAIWRGTWMCGMLANLSHSAQAGFPPVVIERAQAMLDLSLATRESRISSYEEASRAWLGQLAPQLIAKIEVDDRTYDYWELWLATQRSIGRGGPFDAAIMYAMQLLLQTSTDLTRPGPSVNVLGRLVAVAMEHPSEVVKSAVNSYFDDASITSRDLWVLTSLLAVSDEARWFPDALILPEDADQRHRWRVRDDLAAAWPATSLSEETQQASTSQPLRVDAELAQKWSDAVDDLAKLAIDFDSASMLAALVRASVLNEAALQLANAQPQRAEELLDRVARSRGNAPIAPPSTNPAAASSSIAPAPGAASDAAWSAEYQQSGKTTDQRIELIRSLHNRAGGDLGPIDADLFVHEVYKGSPSELRAAAQDAVPQFARGVVVSLAMIDQLADAPENEATSKVVQDFTSQPLPDPRSAGWTAAARLALVQHALSLMPEAHDEMDAMCDALTESFIHRRNLLRHEPSAISQTRSPQQGASSLADAWIEQAQSIAAAGWPDNLTTLNRRRAIRLRLAQGPMQQTVAQQLTILELLAAITIAEQPELQTTVADLIAGAAAERHDAASVLAQSLAIELTESQIWKIRFGLDAHASALDRPSPEPGKRESSHPNPPGTQPGRNDHEHDDDWTSRLQALQPSNPTAYFDLAEEIADASSDESSRELARHVFGLAGALDPQRLGRSVCLALADLETNATHKRRLLALATLLGNAANVTNDLASASQSPLKLDLADSRSSDAAIAVADAFGFYRRGQGSRALETLKHDGAMDLLHRCDRALRDGADAFVEACKRYKNQARPLITTGELVRMLRLESALLSGADRSWSDDLLLDGDSPLIEVDPNRLEEAFNVDASRPYFRGGRWVGE